MAVSFPKTGTRRARLGLEDRALVSDTVRRPRGEVQQAAGSTGPGLPGEDTELGLITSVVALSFPSSSSLYCCPSKTDPK